MIKKIDWRLCLIADTGYRRGLEIVDLVMAAVEAGAGLIQLRAKNLPDRESLALGLALVTKLSKLRIPLIINDRVDLALAAKAAGVHLGQDDMPLGYARTLLGRGHLIGISVTTVEEAHKAEHGGADYIGVGPVFATSTKDCGRPPLGIEGLKKIRQAVKIPILAVGGISRDNARQVVEAGVNGLAVISAVMVAPDPGLAVAELLRVFSVRE